LECSAVFTLPLFCSLLSDQTSLHSEHTQTQPGIKEYTIKYILCELLRKNNTFAAILECVCVILLLTAITFFIQ